MDGIRSIAQLLSDYAKPLIDNMPDSVAIYAFISAATLIVIRVMLTSAMNKSTKKLERTLENHYLLAAQSSKSSYEKEVTILGDIWPKVHEIYEKCGSIDPDVAADRTSLHEMTIELEKYVHVSEPYLTQSTLVSLESFFELVHDKGSDGSSFREIKAKKQAIVAELRKRLIIEAKE